MKRLILAFAIIWTVNPVGAQNQLIIPDTLSGQNISLTLQEGTTEFYTGVITETMGANGSLLGPTILLNQGDFVSIEVDNQLQDTTTIHWHGMHVAPENDGGPHSIIPPDSIWNPQFTVMDKAGINWYHPHLHMHTNEHVSKGIAGMIIVRDQEEASLELPRKYGVDDFPIVIQTKGFNSLGQIEWMSELDTTLMVNGTIDPYLDAPAQVVRLRVLNGSSQRVYKLGFSNNMSFQIIGTDGGLLEAPVSLNRYQIAPGQRADILVDLSSILGQNIQLMNYGTEIGNAIYGSIQPGMMAQLTLPGYTSNPLNGSDFQILDINVISATQDPVTSIPSSLAAHVPLLESDANITRNLTFTSQQNIVGPFMINGAHFDMEVINYTVPLGHIEIWSLTNQTPIAHPFHIHDVQFYILDINGAAPPPELSGLNDVVLVPAGMGNVRFIAVFEDFANETIPYMYHCHMLTHEDKGMMGQFIVSEQAADVKEESKEEILVYPNPSVNGKIYLDLKQPNRLSVSDISGKSIVMKNLKVGINEIELESGIYLFGFESGTVKKVIIQ
ncbi:MAG: multicopper oxidase domain-containing protein [Flavobacteriales bacterium]|nr:multicopper oxidase domain-containing protein [Flavobacteriales bacterium]MCB9198477.1 multicopper oxidase domain-containing protein [Flavobacteriales bacterium]